MCAQKAKFFHEALRLEGDFNASIAWLTRFKQQYSTCETAVQGERLGANDGVANMLLTEFQKSVQEGNLKPDQIYSANEFGFWNGLTTKTLTFEREMCARRHNSSKEHLTVMCCGSAT
jgi:hypothetical protein